jgi:hypothetical protein
MLLLLVGSANPLVTLESYPKVCIRMSLWSSGSKSAGQNIFSVDLDFPDFAFFLPKP